jgi:uncharacterized protein (TIRG00374 family)
LKQFFSTLRVLLFLGIGILLLWLTFRNQSFGSVFEKIKEANWNWMAVSVVLSILALISRAMRWKQLIQSLGYEPRLRSTFNAVMFGYLANMAIPRLGEVSRCGALGKTEKIPFDKLFGTVILERLSDVIMLLLSIIVVAILEFDHIGGFMNTTFFIPMIEKMQSATYLIVTLIGVVIIGIVSLIYLFKMQNAPAFVVKARKLIKGFGEGFASIAKLENKLLFVVHTLFIWTMYWLMTYSCFFALNTTHGLDLMAGLFIMVIGGIGMTAPVQGGIGTYHLLVSKALLIYGLSEMDGIVFATLVHTTQTVLLIILGGASMISLFFFTKPKNTLRDESL